MNVRVFVTSDIKSAKDSNVKPSRDLHKMSFNCLYFGKSEFKYFILLVSVMILESMMRLSKPQYYNSCCSFYLCKSLYVFGHIYWFSRYSIRYWNDFEFLLINTIPSFYSNWCLPENIASNNVFGTEVNKFLETFIVFIPFKSSSIKSISLGYLILLLSNSCAPDYFLSSSSYSYL